MATINFDAIRQRAEKATPGPWTTGDRFGARTMGAHSVIIAGNLPNIELDVYRNGKADARFIAHARQDIPALLALVEQQAAELDAARALIEHVATWRHGGGDPGYDAASALIQAYDEYPHQTETAQ